MKASPLTARSALLQALLSGEDCGSGLMRRLETVTDGQVRLSGGVAYPVLRVMESEGLVTRRRVARANGRGRAAEVYALTDAGRAYGAAQRAAMLALLGEGRA